MNRKTNTPWRWLALWVALCPALATARQRIVIAEPNGVQLRAELFLPVTVTGPVVVALHGCGGPFPRRDRPWTDRLLAAGHPVLLPDSFASRGLKGDCKDPVHIASAYRARRGDAWAAAAWAQAQPFAQPGGVLLLGWSDGGATVLAAVEAPPPHLIRAAIAFYPACAHLAARGGWHADVKLLVLMGAADDWTPPAPCQALLTGQANARLMTFPNAYHDFDAPDDALHLMTGLPHTKDGTGVAHAGSNPRAATAAIAAAMGFFGAPGD